MIITLSFLLSISILYYFLGGSNANIAFINITLGKDTVLLKVKYSAISSWLLGM